jgi:threonine-phosphate decarboxylase
MKYLHGGDVFDKEIDLDFSININPLGMPERVRRAARTAVDQCESYPDYANRKLRAALAAHYSLPAEYFLCGNGAAAVIYELLHAAAPKRVLVPAPTFASYEQAAEGCGSSVLHHMLKESEDFCITDALAEDVRLNKPQMVFVCNPNNPTGSLVERDVLKNILESCKSVQARLVVDECFLGFTHEESFAAYVRDYPELIILSAFTKLYAMPGLRSGFCICSDETFLEKVRAGRQDWNLSCVAQEASAAALGEAAYVEDSRKTVELERDFLQEELQKRGIRVYESAANYLLLYCEKDLYTEFLSRRILIRDCSNFCGLRRGFYRIAVRTHAENERLLEVLEEILNG